MTRFLLSLCLLVLVPPLCLAEDLPKPDLNAPIDIEAKQLDFDQQSGRYHAVGDVRLTQGNLLLTSRELWWNQQTGEVEADGEVHFSAPGEDLRGRRIRYNVQQGTGEVEEGEAYWQEKSLRLTGKRIERLGPNRFRIHQGRFTVCDAERPAWSVGTPQADVQIGRYITARHALIYLKDLPALYLPYLVIPIKTERESGFLMPSLGFSERRGTEFSTAWYQVLGRNMDATFYLDHLSELGTGTGLEYRYIFGRQQRGNFNIYNVFTREDGNRWALDWQHQGQLTDELRLVVDAEYVNKRDYFSDYGQVTGDYNEQKVISSIFLSQSWQRAGLTAQYKSIKDLESEAAHPWQSAPQIDFATIPLRLGSSPFYASLHSSYVNFSRDRGTTGQRLMLRPALNLHRYLIGGLEFDSEIAYRQRNYQQLDTGLAETSGNAEARARLASRFFKVFGGERSSWLHSVEPEISYNYTQENLGADLPDFDRFDQTEARNRLGYALVHRLTGKWLGKEGNETRREVVWLKLSQNYLVQREAQETSTFSNLRTQLILRPSSHGSLSFDVYYDVEQQHVPEYLIDGDISDGRGNSFEVLYHRRQPKDGQALVDNVNLGLSTALLKPLYLRYEQRYDFLNSERLEQVLDLDFRYQCWGLMITLREFEDERSVMFTLNLSGIGEVGRLGRSFGPR